MKDILVSIIPSYLCHYNCPFCFLGNLRENDTLLDLGILKQRLLTISQEYKITQIDLFGGELGELNRSYLKNLINTCIEFNPKLITVTTNFLNDVCLDLVKEYESRVNIILNISLNKERLKNSLVERRVEEYLRTKQLPKHTELSYVVLPSVLYEDKISLLNNLEYFKLPVIFYKYNQSILNSCYNIPNEVYSNFIKQLIFLYKQNNYTFPLGNLGLLDCNNNPTLESNIFINPDGKFGWISYLVDKEVYRYTSNFNDWKEAVFKDINLYAKNCSNCKYYYNRCQAEHLNYNNNSKECCGLKGVLEFYDSKTYLYKNN